MADGGQASGTEQPTAPVPHPLQPFEEEELILHPETPPEVAVAAIKGERLYAIFGALIGLALAGAGVALIVLGAKGSVDWSFKGLGIDSHLQTSVVGVVVVIVGLLVILVTRYKVEVRQ